MPLQKVVIRLYSVQPGVFCPGLFEDGNVRIGILPESEEVLVGASRLVLLSEQDERSAQLQVRHGDDRIGKGDAAMI